MKIWVGFSKHRGFAPLGWLIMRCEGTNFSHTFVRVRSESLNRNLIYQANGSGVFFIGQEMFDRSNQVVEEYEIEVSDAAKVKFLQWAVDSSGKPYGHLQLVGLGMMRLAKLFGLRIKNPFGNRDSAYVCCELVVEALETLGLAGPADLDNVDLQDAQRMATEAADEKGQT